MFIVPSFTYNQTKIPYARVNHNKYMVTDQHAYIGKLSFLDGVLFVFNSDIANNYCCLQFKLAV